MFEFVVSNRSPPDPLIKKFCLVQIGLIKTSNKLHLAWLDLQMVGYIVKAMVEAKM